MPLFSVKAGLVLGPLDIMRMVLRQALVALAADDLCGFINSWPADDRCSARIAI